jgi:hypothetical protein
LVDGPRPVDLSALDLTPALAYCADCASSVMHNPLSLRREVLHRRAVEPMLSRAHLSQAHHPQQVLAWREHMATSILTWPPALIPLLFILYMTLSRTPLINCAEMLSNFPQELLKMVTSALENHDLRTGTHIREVRTTVSNVRIQDIHI